MAGETGPEVPPVEDDNRNIGVIIGIIIFVIIFALLVIVFIALGISDPVTETGVTVEVETGTFLSLCTTTPCNNGLVCDGTNFTCRLPAGVPCSSYTDCVTGLICSGLCATGGVGSLNELCPCEDGYQCTEEITGLNVCKGLGGMECDIGTDCVSTICDNGVCAAGAPNSFPCTMDSTCASGNCSSGFCQEQGVTTGVVGAACAAPCVSFGTAGAGCNSTEENPLVCQCYETNAPGFCATASQGILSSCSPFSACSTNLVCYNDSAGECTSAGSSCICTFPYDNPNSQAPGPSCITGMVPGSQEECFNDTGLGCDIGGMCSTDQCGGGSVMASYNFSISGDTNLKTNFPGALNTSIVPVFSGPSGTIQPYKLFATSSGSTDTIYLVDSVKGLLSVQYDTESGEVSPWVTNLPLSVTTTDGTTTTTKLLIDASYNGTTFIVAYNETVVTTGSTLQNDTVYTGSALDNLTPFNPQTGSGITGTQYTSDGTPLSIDYIDMSPSNNVSPGGDTLISSNGTIYVKQALQATYNISAVVGGPMNGLQMTGLTGPARFYFDVTQNSQGTGSAVCPAQGPNNPVTCSSFQNISFVGPFFVSLGTGATPLSLDQVLQFSGNIAGIALPIDRFGDVQYRVFDYSIYSPTTADITGTTGMLGGSIITLSNAYNNGVFVNTVVSTTFSGITTLLPYRISTSSRSVTTANAFYVLSVGSCTS